MSNMLFELFDGFPFPRLPRNKDGTRRAADGQKFLDLDQAAAAAHRSHDELCAIYEFCFNDLEAPGNLVAGSAAQWPESVREEVSTRLLREEKYGYLGDNHFAAMMEECRRRGLNPWARHLHAEVRHNPQRRRDELHVLLTVDALRYLAEKTREYEGQRGPHWRGRGTKWKTYWTEGGANPEVARVGVFRKGFPEPTWGVAHWKSYAQYVETSGGLDLSEPWARMGELMLAKCAEALALRRAFPERLGGLYTREEMMQADNPPPPGRGTRQGGGEPVPLLAARLSYLRPETLQQFELDLIDLGIRDRNVRARIVQMFRGKFPGLGDLDPAEFFTRAIHEVCRHPEVYGAKAPPEAS